MLVITTHFRLYTPNAFKQSITIKGSSVQFSLFAQSCPTLCNPMDCSTPGLPVHHQLPEFTLTHVQRLFTGAQIKKKKSQPYRKLGKGHGQTVHIHIYTHNLYIQEEMFSLTHRKKYNTNKNYTEIPFFTYHIGKISKV